MITRTRIAVLLVCVLLAGCQAPAAVVPLAPSSTSPPSGCRVVGGKADARCTPGVINPQVTQANIAATICRTGWTATIRPPVSVTEPLKRRQMTAYGDTGSPTGYEEDHLIALEIGGNPTDPRNLWPEPRSGPATAARKDTEENSLRKAVCGGRMKLADAQAQMLRDWRQ